MWPSVGVKLAYEQWERVEPPTGEGYQLWETVSEGSPISPVFSTPEALADWLTFNPEYQWRRNDEGTTREQWLAFIKGPGWALSGVSVGGQFMTGVQASSLS